MKRKKLIKRLILVAVVLVVPIFLLKACQHTEGVAAKAADAPSLVRVPKDATDITYFLPGLLGPSMYYEFNTTESGYRSWVADFRDPRTSPVQRGRFDTYRYDIKAGKSDSLLINDALYATWLDGDVGESMVYDLKTGRAYYHFHSR